MAYKDPEVQRAYQRDWVKRRRDTWIEEHGPCWICGSDKHLEVDHVDPRAKLSHRVWSWAKARREAELAKCQVLCRRCHHDKSNAQNPHVNVGENHPRSKLTLDQVKQIRTLTGSSAEVARLFGVSSSAIRNIRQGRTWTHA